MRVWRRTQEQDLQVRPRAAWYGVTAALWVVGLVLFAFAVVAIAHVVNSGVDRAVNHADVAVPQDGLTFYTTDPDSVASCALSNGSGQQVPLDTLGFTMEISINGPTYYAVGVTPHSMAAGAYRLDCRDVRPDAIFGFGPRVDVKTMATRFIWGVALPLALGLIGLVLLIVVAVKRHGAKSRIRSMHAYAVAGHGQVWNPAYVPRGPTGAGRAGSGEVDRLVGPTETHRRRRHHLRRGGPDESTHRCVEPLGHEDAGEAALVLAVRLDIPEPGVASDVLGHLLVGVQTDLLAVVRAGTLLRELQQESADGAPLLVGCDGDVVEQHVIGSEPQHEVSHHA